jgi:hypothetical protein
MSIVFLERLLEWKDAQSMLMFGIAIGVVAAALIAFSLFGEKE